MRFHSPCGQGRWRPFKHGRNRCNLKGTVRFEGVVPKPKVISMAADPSCAKQHSSPVIAQEVMTDSKGDLQNVIVFVADGLGDRTFDPPAQPVVVEEKGCMYMPHVLAVRANQPLHLVNDDPRRTISIPRPRIIENGTRRSRRDRAWTNHLPGRRSQFR